MIKNITDLHNAEIGNELIIVGGGTSVTEWKKNYKPKKNQKIMCINFFHQLGIDPDYNIYQDYAYKVYIEMGTIKIPDKTRLIGLKEQVSYRTDYYFIQNEVIMAGTHSGFIALQIADKILNPDRIYLIGLDYYKENDKIHYYDKYFSEFTEIMKLRYCSAFEAELNDFRKIRWNKERIINLNPKSRLRI